MSQITKVFEDGHARQYPVGQILLYQGEKSHDTFYIRNGYVKVYDIDSKGNEKVLLILGKGDIFPLIWTFGASDSLLYFYETLQDSELSVILRTDFIQHIEESHKFTVMLLKYFVSRTKELMTRVESIEGSSALHKVGQVLQYLGETHGKVVGKNTKKIILPVTHQLIAQMSGLTRETVSLQMKHFQENQAIENNTKLIIHVDRVEKLLNTDS